MTDPRRAILLVVAAVLGAGCRDASGGGDRPRLAGGLRAEVVAAGLQDPVHLTAPAGDARLFVVEKVGRIRIVKDGRLLDTPFLDLRAMVSRGSEQGLLSVAFHPRYAQTGLFYVNYTDAVGDTRVERYRVSADPDVADATSARLVLHVAQPYANHNGGHVLFGPDGMLYVATGDGGSAGDPQNRAQSTRTLLGKLLRLDVDGGDPYAVPPDNPFAGDPVARQEIWALGLRNPWRVAFDAAAGRLYVADVGQDRLEEVNAVRADAAGLNFGWRVMEGTACYAAASCDRTGLVLPVLAYGRGDGCSVTGGLVYRGGAMPALAGTYFYSDFCRGWLRSFRLAGGRAGERREWPVGDLGNVLSFGEDAAGELYVLSGDGTVRKLVPR